jgi:lysophospholipase L1-like esterase
MTIARLRPVVLILLSALALTAEAADPPVRTLGRVFAKLKAGQPVTIVFFGGSITAAPGYRVKVTKWFESQFPSAKVNSINAAIGGTGSDLGAFRCGTDVIAHNPDLVFVEFNINDGSPANDFRKATMEGIVRQLWSSPSQPEVVFLYTTSRTLKERRASHPAVAKHYGIADIDLQPALLEALNRPDLPKPTPEQLNNPKFDWKQPGQVFMSDSVHPNDLGHTIYADAITNYLKSQSDTSLAGSPVLPRPLISDEFARTKMVPAGEAKLSGDWEVTPPSKTGRYRDGTINARKPGDARELVFDGTALGLFLDVQKDGGKFSWTIDDGKNLPGDPAFGGPKGIKHGTVDTAPGPYFPRNHYAMLACGLETGKHTLKIRVLDERDKTSTGNRLRIGYFLLGGVAQGVQAAHDRFLPARRPQSWGPAVRRRRNLPPACVTYSTNRA